MDSLSLIGEALMRLAVAAEEYVKLEKQRFEKEYPTRTVVPATVGKAKYKSDEDQARPEETGEVFPEENYDVIGPREARVREREAARLARQKDRRTS